MNANGLWNLMGIRTDAEGAYPFTIAHNVRLVTGEHIGRGGLIWAMATFTEGAVLGLEEARYLEPIFPRRNYMLKVIKGNSHTSLCTEKNLLVKGMDSVEFAGIPRGAVWGRTKNREY